MRPSGQENRVDLNIILTSLYETEFRLFDHLNNLSSPTSNPLAIVKMHDSELPDDTIRWNLLMDEYVDNDIYTYFHITFNEFIDYPRHIRKQMRDYINKRKSSKEEEKNKIEKEIKKELDVENI